jgi:dTDP-4-dehydrorhamnose reductase
MKLLVTGFNGQLGQCLRFVTKTSNEITPIGLHRSDLDLSQTVNIKNQTLKAIDTHKPDLIINLAAYTKVDQAEDDNELAYSINAKALRELGAACHLSQIPIIHISTDYVFDGLSKHDYNEGDKTNPLSVYGRTKREGEINLLEKNPNALILRTSWVTSPFGQNFVKTMLRLAQTHEHIKVVNDQWGAPTSGLELAKTIIALANSLRRTKGHEFSGIYHTVSPDHANWYELASFIFDDLKERTGSRPNLTAIPTSQYPTKAIRPRRSVLSPKKLKTDFGLSLLEWRKSLKADLDLIHAKAP